MLIKIHIAYVYMYVTIEFTVRLYCNLTDQI